MEAVTLRGVSFTYPKSEYPALRAVDFVAEKGGFYLVTGASAAGKSTLLSLLKKEIAPRGALNGDIEVNGTVGYLCQNAEESIVCSNVRSELAFGAENLGKSREEIDLLIAETAAYFNLENKLVCDTAQLSSGEKQLVCLAAVMMMKPDILVLDEPCAMLDPVAGERFAHLLLKLYRDFGLTVILSEHSTELLYEEADGILLLENGAPAFCGTPREMLSYMKETHHPLLSIVPARLRYDKNNLHYKTVQEETDKTAPALEAKRLWFAYQKGEDVLRELSLSVPKGKISAVIGCNGSGKTTLLKVLCGVKKPYRGKVHTAGEISMLTQNVKDIFTKERCDAEVSFGALTDTLGISDIAASHPWDLSGGQAQRLALAKVLERGADILLLDEPTKGLDAVLKSKLGTLLRQLCSEGKTVLLVSHDLDFIGEWADEVAFLSEGRIARRAPKRSFFSALSYYTTSLARLTGGKAVCTEDLEDE